MYDIFEKFGWLLFIALSIVQAAFILYRAQPLIQANPALEQEYNQFIKGFLIFFNIPWIVMGIGSIFGGVNNMDFSYPRKGNPFVLAFQVTFILWLAVAAWWIYLRGGAEYLAAHPGWGRPPFEQSPRWIKIIAALMLFSGITSIISMWTQVHS
jgi:hypothetical protein